MTTMIKLVKAKRKILLVTATMMMIISNLTACGTKPSDDVDTATNVETVVSEETVAGFFSSHYFNNIDKVAILEKC